MLPSRAQVLLLQHPRESRNPVGTARMAHLQLPGSALCVGVDFSSDAQVRAWLAARATAPTVVLYPGEGAQDAANLRNHPGPINVIALDGTWWQAKKLWQKNSWLHTLHAYILSPTEPGRYRIRREPESHCLATVEALGAVLDLIEDAPGQHASLLHPFDAMVEHQLAFAHGPMQGRRRMRTHPRPKKVRPVDEALHLAAPNLLLVHGEGNCFSIRSKEPGPGPRLLLWTALRPATGERFEALLDTQGELAPNAYARLALVDGALPTAMSAHQFAHAWARFLVPEDAWVAWGTHSLNLYALQGGVLPAGGVFNAQKLLHERLFQRQGTLERAGITLGLTSPPPAPLGRAAQRLELLAGVVRALLLPG